MKKLRSHLLVAFAFAAATALAAAPYPSKPLEIVVANNPGSGWDQAARMVNATLEKEKLYPQPMSVVNKPGGGGTVGFLYMQSQAKNDYELIPFSAPLIFKSIDTTLQGSYKDLTPLAGLTVDFECVVVRADSPYKTINDLFAAIKKDPTQVKMAGGSSPGSMDHVAFLKMAQAGGVDPTKVIYVAFSGGGEAMTTLLGGNVAFLCTGTGEAVPQLKAGTVRILGISSPSRRGGDLKDVPTVKEQGVDVTYEVWRGLFGAPGMSKEAQAYWAGTIKKMVATPTWKGFLDQFALGDGYMDQAAFAKFLDNEYATSKDLLTKIGLVR
ncbi:MAG: tripartite tricarboxylate transporter substrate binding protein [Treponema sp.]|nr:tripartite tricarboxylate transporter substrate binding protein [Treponema sp.]